MENDGVRSIYESIILREVLIALDDWKYSNSSNCVLIGDLIIDEKVEKRNDKIDEIIKKEELKSENK